MAKPDKDDRLFAPFPIEMDEHPKIIGLSDAAFRAVFEATFYARRMLSDGFLDERVVLKRWGAEVASELSSNDPEKPSWVRVETPRPGWQIHDFAKHHPLRAEIEAKRAETSAKRAAAGRKGAAKRWQNDGNAIANNGTEAETQSETETETTPSSNEEGGAPPRQCKKHPHWDHDERCRACGKDRTAYEAWEAAQASKPRPAKPHEHRWLPDGTCNTCEARKEDEP